MGDKTPLQILTEARAALDAYTSKTGDGFSDPEWVRLNNAVIDAEKNVPFGRQRGWGYVPAND